MPTARPLSPSFPSPKFTTWRNALPRFLKPPSFPQLRFPPLKPPPKPPPPITLIFWGIFPGRGQFRSNARHISARRRLHDASKTEVEGGGDEAGHNYGARVWKSEPRVMTPAVVGGAAPTPEEGRRGGGEIEPPSGLGRKREEEINSRDKKSRGERESRGGGGGICTERRLEETARSHSRQNDDEWRKCIAYQQPQRKGTHHPHLGKVEQPVVGEVWRALLDEGEVGEVHAQVGDARGVGAVKGVAEVAEAAVGAHQGLELVDRVASLGK